jgi:hypothetical protein
VGVIGDGINILIFASVRSYRTTVCTFYYLISSMVNITILLVNVSIRVAFDGYALELGRTSNVLCKARRYFSGVLSAIPLCYACLAIIDQFCVTSANNRLRNLSSIKWAHRIVIIVLIICFLYGIPYLIFDNLDPISGVCLYMSPVFAIYVPLFIVIVLTIMVSFILIIFGCLSYRNIQRTIVLAEQGAQKQITTMVCMQVILVVSCLTPYCFYEIYVWCRFGLIHIVDPNSVEYCVSTLFGLLTWANYAVCFIRCTNIVYIVSYNF